MNDGSIVKRLLGIIDSAGQSANLGQIGATGNYWRLQVGTGSITADGSNGFANFGFPITLQSLTGGIVVAAIVGDDYGGYVSQTEFINTASVRARCPGITSGTVQFMVWGQCAS